MSSPPLALVPWKRGEHHRLYVNAHGGTSLGWLDHMTDKVHLEAEQHRQTVLAALHPQAGVPRVARWTRGGHRRLYVSDAPDGEARRQLGWGDVATGDVVVEPGQDRGRVEAALACHKDWRAWASPPDVTGADAEPAQSDRGDSGKGLGLIRRLLRR